MEKHILIEKKYNHMDFEMPFGFNITFGFNCFNVVLGVISPEAFTMVSGLAGLTMNLIYFLVKMYWMIKNNKNPDAEAAKNNINAAPFERHCMGCGQSFVPEHPDQIFHDADCKDAYMTNLKDRRPLLTAKKSE
jgi:hypothetical protein